MCVVGFLVSCVLLLFCYCKLVSPTGNSYLYPTSYAFQYKRWLSLLKKSVRAWFSESSQARARGFPR